MRSAIALLPLRCTLCFSEVLISTRKTCNAGASPKIRLAASETPNANSKTPVLIPVSVRRGTSPGASATSVREPQYAKATPSIPATSASSTLSVTSCRRCARAWRQAPFERRFRGPSDSSSQKHIRQVGAGDQQDYTHGLEHHVQRRSKIADHFVAQPRDRDVLCFVARRIAFRQAIADAVIWACACSSDTPGFNRPTTR